MAAILHEERHAAGREIFRPGDPPDAFYLIREGSVSIVRENPGRPVQLLARLGRGDFFGEVGLLDDLPRTEAARTREASLVLRAPRGDFISYLAHNPLLELRFRAAAIQRHTANVTASLNVGTREDVRIRVGREITLTPASGAPTPVQLENLSVGGACIAGAPEGWHPPAHVRFTLGPPEQPDLLAVSGKVSWRRGRRVGIAFDRQEGHEVRIARSLRILLDDLEESRGSS